MTSSTKSKQKKVEKEMMDELRKQGINPDMISEINDDFTYNDTFDEYGDDSYNY